MSANEEPDYVTADRAFKEAEAKMASAREISRSADRVENAALDRLRVAKQNYERVLFNVFPKKVFAAGVQHADDDTINLTSVRIDEKGVRLGTYSNVYQENDDGDEWDSEVQPLIEFTLKQAELRAQGWEASVKDAPRVLAVYVEKARAAANKARSTLEKAEYELRDLEVQLAEFIAVES